MTNAPPMPSNDETKTPSSTFSFRHWRALVGHSSLGILPLRQFGANGLQELLGQLDAVSFGVFASFVLDADEAVILVLLHHDVEHLVVVGAGLLALVVELVRLGRHALGEGHQFVHALVAVVLGLLDALDLANAEVAEVR